MRTKIILLFILYITTIVVLYYFRTPTKVWQEDFSVSSPLSTEKSSNSSVLLFSSMPSKEDIGKISPRIPSQTVDPNESKHKSANETEAGYNAFETPKNILKIESLAEVKSLLIALERHFSKNNSPIDIALTGLLQNLPTALVMLVLALILAKGDKTKNLGQRKYFNIVVYRYSEESDVTKKICTIKHNIPLIFSHEIVKPI